MPVLIALPLAQERTEEGLSELFAEPALLVAAILLITVSIAWIVIARLVNSYIRAAAYAARRRAAAGRRRGQPPVAPGPRRSPEPPRAPAIPPPPDKKIWDYPP